MSMAAGRAVLRVIEKEGLQQNCVDVGGYLVERLRCARAGGQGPCGREGPCGACGG